MMLTYRGFEVSTYFSGARNRVGNCQRKSTLFVSLQTVFLLQNSRVCHWLPCFPADL